MVLPDHQRHNLYATGIALHWLQIAMTATLLLILPWQVNTQQGQTSGDTNTDNGPDVTAGGSGLSDVLIVIIVAACIGLVLAIVFGIFCYFHYKRTHLGELSLETETLPQQYKKSAQSNVQVTSIELTEAAKSESNTPTHYVEETDHRPSPIVINKWKDFKRLLEELRPQADTLLVMLNDVRKRLKEAKHGNPRIGGYKAVIRDLSRVLFLVNKKEDKIKMPPDGVELLMWAQQIVNKYTDCQKIKEDRKINKSYSTPPEMSAVLWIQSKDDSAFDDEEHQESHII